MFHDLGSRRSLVKSALSALFGRFRRPERIHTVPQRGQVDHIVIFDGTLSTLAVGRETNAGLTYKLLASQTGQTDIRQSIYYEPGVQWPDWTRTRDVITGRGINRMIRRAYGAIATRYTPGDRIYLFGYSRGAYAVRSLAGAIDRMGLLQQVHATERMVSAAYRHYRLGPDTPIAEEFTAAYCHRDVPIEIIGVWDTVRALGIKVPGVARWIGPNHAHHNHALGPCVREGVQALALDETRTAFSPVLWDTPAHEGAVVDQLWFRGAHGDVGGQLAGYEAARPLSNIPLTWVLGRAEEAGLSLPPDWRALFPTDSSAPASGMNRRWGKVLWSRRRRKPGRDGSERLHPSAKGHHLAEGLSLYAPDQATSRKGAVGAKPNA